MSAPFVIAKKKFDNLGKFSIRKIVIQGFQPVKELKFLNSQLFNSLNIDSEDSYKFKNLAWTLQKTIESSIHPFDDSSLGLREKLDAFKDESQYYPATKQIVLDIESTVNLMIQNPKNPKRAKLFETLNNPLIWGKLGIVSRVERGGILPGWKKENLQILNTIRQKISVIDGISTLRSNLFGQILLASGGRNCPLIEPIVEGFCCEELILIFYDCEYEFQQTIKSLPNGTNIGMFTNPIQIGPISPSNDDNLRIVDKWHEDSFWLGIRREFQNSNKSSCNSHPNSFSVNSRILSFGESKKIALDEEHKIIEISSLIDFKSANQIDLNTYPRKRVSDIQSGDLIVIRTSGCGQDLHEISNTFMTEVGKDRLFDDAVEWKNHLKEILLSSDNNSHRIAAALNLGNPKSYTPDYIWKWTTNSVIRPGSYKAFISLIDAMNSIKPIKSTQSHEEYAKEKWELMTELIRYRKQAALKVRKLLLQKLRDIIRKGIEIENEHQLRLSKIDGGDLTIFRVIYIDPSTTKLPYNKIGVITKL